MQTTQMAEAQCKAMPNAIVVVYLLRSKWRNNEGALQTRTTITTSRRVASQPGVEVIGSSFVQVTPGVFEHLEFTDQVQTVEQMALDQELIQVD